MYLPIYILYMYLPIYILYMYIVYIYTHLYKSKPKYRMLQSRSLGCTQSLLFNKNATIKMVLQKNCPFKFFNIDMF